MNFTLKNTVISATLIAILCATPAYAIFGVGDIVLDPTNLVKNTVTAAKTVLTEINTAKSAVENVKHTIALLKSIQNIGNLAKVTNLQNELQLYNQLKATDAQLFNSINQTTQYSMNLKAKFGASGFSWDNYYKGNTQADLDRSKAMQARYQNLNDSIQNSNNRRVEIMTQLNNSDGSVVAAAQATTASVDNLSGQMSQMVSQMAYQTAQQAAALQNSTTVESAANDAWNKRQDDLLRTGEKYNMPYIPAK